jgi:hypothetical protein
LVLILTSTDTNKIVLAHEAAAVDNTSIVWKIIAC